MGDDLKRMRRTVTSLQVCLVVLCGGLAVTFFLAGMPLAGFCWLAAEIAWAMV